MNIEFVEKLINSMVEGNRKDSIKLLSDLISSESKLGHKNNVQRLKNLLKKVPPTGYIVSSLVLKNSPTNTANLLFEKISSDIALEDSILENEIKPQISSFLTEWESADKLIAHGVPPSNKLLFYGEPGTGKTRLAYGLANKLGLPLILVRLDEVISSYLGKTGKNIREIFDLAQRERVIIFLDEIDTLAKHRDDSKELGELKRVVTVLLQNIDRFPENSILVGATNHESLLDSAIWRRFPIKVEFKKPSEESRRAIFNLYLTDFADSEMLDLLAELSEDLTGSSIFDLSQKMKKLSILEGSKLINISDVVRTFSPLIKLGLSKKSSNIRTKIYRSCKILLKAGSSTREISEITGIPYTTLRDNLKVNKL